MSGHSKWSNIKRQKGLNDSKRSQTFSKLSRLITIAARDFGADPDANPTLRLAIEKAKYANMPKENIQKAIDKGAGKGGDSEVLFDLTYEGFGPNGEAFYIKAITDNKNRTVSELRNLFSRSGGNLGVAGSTAYIFGTDLENPLFKVEIDTEENMEKLLKLYDSLSEQDDVQSVFVNFDLP